MQFDLEIPSPINPSAAQEPPEVDEALRIPPKTVPEPESTAGRIIETLHLYEPEPDHDTLFKLLDISACFYKKHQLSPSEVSQLTGIDETEVRRILNNWYQAVVISPGIGETYWMSDRDKRNFTDRILAPTHRAWEQTFPGQKILCPPTLYNRHITATVSEH